jgi:drug/metabolite transporter (DMT)-like permease
MKVPVSMMLAVAVLAVSTSAPLIRGAQSLVPEGGLAFSLFLAAARMSIASLIMVGPTLVSRRGVTRKALLYTVLAGLFLGLHFGLWIGSLAFTSVAASVTLVTTNPTLFYIGLSNIVAMLVLLPVAAIFGVEPTQVPTQVWIFVLAMALIPQMIGHGAIAWSLTKVSASLVALVVLFEPLVSGLLAWAIFEEVPGPMVLVGAIVVLSGVFVVLTDRLEQVSE